jgi:excisionase family DNA binding protein
MSNATEHSSEAAPQRSESSASASPWLTPAACAAYLRIALGTLRNWTSEHFIPYSKRGGVVRYHKETIDRWLARGGCQGRSNHADV